MMNILHVLTLGHNLLPPFFLRQAGITVNETAKIHCAYPSVKDHAIIISSPELVIPLQVYGTFEFLHTRVPTEEE